MEVTEAPPAAGGGIKRMTQPRIDDVSSPASLLKRKRGRPKRPMVKAKSEFTDNKRPEAGNEDLCIGSADKPSVGKEDAVAKQPYAPDSDQHKGQTVVYHVKREDKKKLVIGRGPTGIYGTDQNRERGTGAGRARKRGGRAGKTTSSASALSLSGSREVSAAQGAATKDATGAPKGKRIRLKRPKKPGETPGGVNKHTLKPTRMDIETVVSMLESSITRPVVLPTAKVRPVLRVTPMQNSASSTPPTTVVPAAGPRAPGPEPAAVGGDRESPSPRHPLWGTTHTVSVLPGSKDDPTLRALTLPPSEKRPETPILPGSMVTMSSECFQDILAEKAACRETGSTIIIIKSHSSELGDANSSQQDANSGQQDADSTQQTTANASGATQSELTKQDSPADGTAASAHKAHGVSDILQTDVGVCVEKDSGSIGREPETHSCFPVVACDDPNPFEFSKMSPHTDDKCHRDSDTDLENRLTPCHSKLASSNASSTAPCPQSSPNVSSTAAMPESAENNVSSEAEVRHDTNNTSGALGVAAATTQNETITVTKSPRRHKPGPKCSQRYAPSPTPDQTQPAPTLSCKMVAPLKLRMIRPGPLCSKRRHTLGDQSLPDGGPSDIPTAMGGLLDDIDLYSMSPSSSSPDTTLCEVPHDELYTPPEIDREMMERLKSTWVFQHKTNGLFTYFRSRKKPPKEVVSEWYRDCYEPHVLVARLKQQTEAQSASMSPQVQQDLQEIRMKREMRKVAEVKVEVKARSLFRSPAQLEDFSELKSKVNPLPVGFKIHARRRSSIKSETGLPILSPVKDMELPPLNKLLGVDEIFLPEPEVSQMTDIAEKEEPKEEAKEEVKETTEVGEKKASNKGRGKKRRRGFRGFSGSVRRRRKRKLPVSKSGNAEGTLQGDVKQEAEGDVRAEAPGEQVSYDMQQPIKQETSYQQSGSLTDDAHDEERGIADYAGDEYVLSPAVSDISISLDDLLPPSPPEPIHSNTTPPRSTETNIFEKMQRELSKTVELTEVASALDKLDSDMLEDSHGDIEQQSPPEEGPKSGSEPGSPRYMGSMQDDDDYDDDYDDEDNGKDAAMPVLRPETEEDEIYTSQGLKADIASKEDGHQSAATQDPETAICQEILGLMVSAVEYELDRIGAEHVNPAGQSAGAEQRGRLRAGRVRNKVAKTSGRRTVKRGRKRKIRTETESLANENKPSAAEAFSASMDLAEGEAGSQEAPIQKASGIPRGKPRKKRKRLNRPRWCMKRKTKPKALIEESAAMEGESPDNAEWYPSLGTDFPEDSVPHEMTIAAGDKPGKKTNKKSKKRSRKAPKRLIASLYYELPEWPDYDPEAFATGAPPTDENKPENIGETHDISQSLLDEQDSFLSQINLQIKSEFDTQTTMEKMSSNSSPVSPIMPRLVHEAQGPENDPTLEPMATESEPFAGVSQPTISGKEESSQPTHIRDEQTHSVEEKIPSVEAAKLAVENKVESLLSKTICSNIASPLSTPVNASQTENTPCESAEAVKQWQPSNADSATDYSHRTSVVTAEVIAPVMDEKETSMEAPPPSSKQAKSESDNSVEQDIAGLSQLSLSSASGLMQKIQAEYKKHSSELDFLLKLGKKDAVVGRRAMNLMRRMKQINEYLRQKLSEHRQKTTDALDDDRPPLTSPRERSIPLAPKNPDRARLQHTTPAGEMVKQVLREKVKASRNRKQQIPSSLKRQGFYVRDTGSPFVPVAPHPVSNIGSGTSPLAPARSPGEVKAPRPAHSPPMAHSRNSTLQVIVDRPPPAHSKPVNYCMYTQLKCSSHLPTRGEALSMAAPKAQEQQGSSALSLSAREISPGAMMEAGPQAASGVRPGAAGSSAKRPHPKASCTVRELLEASRAGRPGPPAAATQPTNTPQPTPNITPRVSAQATLPSIIPGQQGGMAYPYPLASQQAPFIGMLPPSVAGVASGQAAGYSMVSDYSKAMAYRQLQEHTTSVLSLLKDNNAASRNLPYATGMSKAPVVEKEPARRLTSTEPKPPKQKRRRVRDVVVGMVPTAPKLPSSGVTQVVSDQGHVQVVPSVVCDRCGGLARFVCSGCKTVAYCSQSCQADAWRDHHKICK